LALAGVEWALIVGVAAVVRPRCKKYLVLLLESYGLINCFPGIIFWIFVSVFILLSDIVNQQKNNNLFLKIFFYLATTVMPCLGSHGTKLEILTISTWHFNFLFNF